MRAAKWHKSHAIIEPRPRWLANPVDPIRPVSSLFIIPRIFQRAPERRRMQSALSACDAFARRRFRFRVSSHRRICNELCGGHAGGSADRCCGEEKLICASAVYLAVMPAVKSEERFIRGRARRAIAKQYL